MKRLSFILTAVLLFCAIAVLEAKTPKECNSGTVSGCEGVKSEGVQCMDESKCPVVVSTKVAGSFEKVVISTEGEKVIVGPDGKKYLEHTVGVGTKVVTYSVIRKKNNCCSCECCKNCEKCNCKYCKQDNKNKIDKSTCTCDCCKDCKKNQIKMQ